MSQRIALFFNAYVDTLIMLD